MGPGVVTARSWLVNEDCEGTGTPAGWVDNTGTPNWDYTAVPLEGSQSLYLSIATAAHRTAINFGDRDEVYAYFLMRYTNGSAPGSIKTVASIAPNGSFVSIVNMQLAATLRFNLSTPSPTLVTTADTTYHTWLHYKKGTGADAIVSIGLSTSGVRPTSGSGYAEVTNAVATLQAGHLIFGTAVTTTNEDFIFDKIRVSDTLIGDNGT